MRWVIEATLVGMLIFDVSLVTGTVLFPQLWFDSLHGSEAYSADALTFLRRCDAMWVAFAVFQAIALWRWRSAPVWLAVVAGLRGSDLWTDLTYAATAAEMTATGWASLVGAGLFNLTVTVGLLVAWRRITGGAV